MRFSSTAAVGIARAHSESIRFPQRQPRQLQGFNFITPVADRLIASIALAHAAFRFRAM